MHQFTSANDAQAYIFGGKSLFTIKSLKTGAHYTFKVTRSLDGKVSFVSLFSDHRYKYLGIIVDGQIKKSAKSYRAPTAFTALTWTLSHLMYSKIPDLLEIYHHNTCGACGRKLTTPDSIKRGIGPECQKKMAMT